MLPPESGFDGWLRYAALPGELRASHRQYSSIVALEQAEISPVFVAGRELQEGIEKILGQQVQISSTLSAHELPLKSGVIVGTVAAFASAGGSVEGIPALKEDGFWLNTGTGGDETVLILGQNERGALYGAFEYLSILAQGRGGVDAQGSARAYNPSASIRCADQWDNLDGSIERGYGGRSIFFKDGFVIDDLTRVKQYARLLASVRLNSIFINNVNANPGLLSDRNLQGLRRVADIMRSYGLRVGISLYFDAPRDHGGLPTSDPLDPEVNAWWAEVTARVCEHVPDLFGYLIKANSEGQPGPLTYGRTLADGANMFARALRAQGDGIVMYRAFVYNHHLDESDPKNDRANAAVDYFDGLDAQFDENVVVQVKFGPIDFQIREPPSPLLAHLRKTGAVIEFMVAQEYLGQQTHYVYQAPLWKTILDFDLRVDGKPSVVRDILSGERFGWEKRSGYSAVVNVGNDDTWLGHHLSLSNLYAYGRLAWDPQADEVEVLKDWSRLTFGPDPTGKVVEVITALAMDSWPTYENYSGNLGIQTLCDILYTHFGPGPASQDGNGWGQWTRADAHGLGMDRTVATGTGNAGQYPPEVAAVFENIESCPDELLLWFHHVPYTHRLKGGGGKTVIQHFYDAHYEGAAEAQTFPARWRALRGLVDDARFDHVALRLGFQAGHSLVWRDSICEFYRAKSGVQDERGRVGNHPWRVEAEDMALSGYKVVDVTPFEAASGGRAVVTASAAEPGTATATLGFPSGTYDIAVNYFDHLGGRSRYELSLVGSGGEERLVGRWHGDLEDKLGHDFSETLDGHSATRITFPGIPVPKGEVLKVVGWPDGSELAPLDYISVLPTGTVD